MENCKITNPQCDNMAAILIFIKKGRIGAKISFWLFSNSHYLSESNMQKESEDQRIKGLFLYPHFISPA